MKQTFSEKTKRVIDIVSGLAVIFTIFFIALQWYVMQSGSADTHDLAVAAKGQAETTKNSVVAGNRSWVEVVAAPPFDKGISRTALRQLKTLAFDLTYTNVGKTPAKNIVLAANVDVVDSSKASTLSYGDIHATQTQSILYPTRSGFLTAVLYAPGAVAGAADNAVTPITPQLREELLRGDKYIVVYADGNFSDEFGNHWFRYCLWLSFVNHSHNFGSGNCAAYNNTGDLP